MQKHNCELLVEGDSVTSEKRLHISRSPIRNAAFIRLKLNGGGRAAPLGEVIVQSHCRIGGPFLFFRFAVDRQSETPPSIRLNGMVVGGPHLIDPSLATIDRSLATIDRHGQVHLVRRCNGVV